MLVDLNALLPSSSRWSVDSATDINDLGQITGEGTLGEQTRAFLLTPPRREQLANVAAAVAGIVPGRKSFERRASVLLGSAQGDVRGGRVRAACADLRAVIKQARGNRGLGSARRDAVVYAAEGLLGTFGC
jgi:hypothetical protein